MCIIMHAVSMLSWLLEYYSPPLPLPSPLLPSQDCGLVGESLPSSAVVKVLVEDNPVAMDGEDYNLQIKAREDTHACICLEHS